MWCTQHGTEQKINKKKITKKETDNKKNPRVYTKAVQCEGCVFCRTIEFKPEVKESKIRLLDGDNSENDRPYEIDNDEPPLTQIICVAVYRRV